MGTFFVSPPLQAIGVSILKLPPPVCQGTTWSSAFFTFRCQVSYSSVTADCSIFFGPTWAFGGWFEYVHLLRRFSCSKTSWSAWSTKNAGSRPKNGALAGGIAKKHQRGAASRLCRATFPAWLNSHRSQCTKCYNQAELPRQTLLDKSAGLAGMFCGCSMMFLWYILW